MVYVNGVARAGDPYRTGRTILPILLRRGSNQLLFHVAAEEFRCELVPARGPVLLDLRDASFPDLVRGETGTRYASLLVLNARQLPLTDAQVTAVRAGGSPIRVPVGPIPACGLRRVTVPIDARLSENEQQAEAARVQIDLTVPGGDDQRPIADTAAFDLAIVDPDERHTRTFLSEIDGVCRVTSCFRRHHPPRGSLPRQGDHLA